MNLWQCNYSDNHGRCKNTCVGVGGAVGLLAIGWYFQLGPTLYCPAHRPDGINGKGKYLDCVKDNCPQCKATAVAEFWQEKIRKGKLK